MPRIDSISSVAPAGHSSTAARSSAELNEPLRRLPAIPTIRISFSFAFGFRHFVDDLREPQRAGTGVLAIGIDEIELADALGAFAQRQRLERAGLQLAADALLRIPAEAEAHRGGEDRGRHVAHGPALRGLDAGLGRAVHIALAYHAP